MRYKIEYSTVKTDKWGHILSEKGFTEYASTLQEAIEKAIYISKAFWNWDVNILDKKGPKLDEDDVDGETTWCINSYKKGKLIFSNDLYFSCITK